MTQITVLYSKIHRATVTDAQLHYEGSLTIDRHLMELAGLAEYQQIDVYNITNGERFTTYAIVGEAHTGIIQVNGAAAHRARTGDLIIIASYAQIPQVEAKTWKPKLVFVDRDTNKPTDNKPAMLPV
ncbi:MAG: aspartate decarboxylase [Vampirovibrio sp.]|jgi:aspartate 1-decarboxylase|nr:aspartate decarboxylase [Vampirovibrio sp.]